MINTRDEICNILPENCIGCEIGVFEGEFSSILLSSKKFKQLYLVDTFCGIASNNNLFYHDASVLEKIVKDRFINHEEIIVEKKDSISFLRSIPDNFFDFIYIDTVHSYELTILELEESHRCIKHLGYICGHDYSDKFFPGVVKAVNEFCTKNNFKYEVTQQIENYPSFIIQCIK
jgi:hypothetical protein